MGRRVLINAGWYKAVESLNHVIRGATKTRCSFPSEDAEKLFYSPFRSYEKTSRTVSGWLTVVDQFAIMFEDRFKPIRG